MSRQAALAALAEARALIVRLNAGLDDALELFYDPTDDRKKEDRAAILDAMVDDAGSLSRLIELVQDTKYKDIFPDDDEENEEAGEEEDEDAA